MPRNFDSERLNGPLKKVSPAVFRKSRLLMYTLYGKCRKQRIAIYNDSMDYADFIHGLWNTMLRNSEFADDALAIQEALGDGDAIQLLSEIVSEHHAKSND